jgi:hypothetical protein
LVELHVPRRSFSKSSISFYLQKELFPRIGTCTDLFMSSGKSSADEIHTMVRLWALRGREVYFWRETYGVHSTLEVGELMSKRKGINITEGRWLMKMIHTYDDFTKAAGSSFVYLPQSRDHQLLLARFAHIIGVMADPD